MTYDFFRRTSMTHPLQRIVSGGGIDRSIDRRRRRQILMYVASRGGSKIKALN